jgi:hypothetical protein
MVTIHNQKESWLGRILTQIDCGFPPNESHGGERKLELIHTGPCEGTNIQIVRNLIDIDGLQEGRKQGLMRMVKKRKGKRTFESAS